MPQQWPSDLPIRNLDRAYYALISQEATPLTNVRGIEYRKESDTVFAIQVRFAYDADYPDTLREDGSIEHIGEGKERIQSSTGGKHGMITAQQLGYEIPDFQSVGPKGSRRCAALGSYRVLEVQRRQLRIRENDYETEAYVFLLQPAHYRIMTESTGLTGSSANDRGGFQTPIIRAIAKEPPKPSTGDAEGPDPEVRRQANERRIAAHFALVKAFEARANLAGLECKCDQYADALCDGNIFEMKSLDSDEVAQVCAAVGQLYRYMFIHRNLPGYETPKLYAVFDRAIDADLAIFLNNVARIGVIWLAGSSFSDQTTSIKLPWLIK